MNPFRITQIIKSNSFKICLYFVPKMEFHRPNYPTTRHHKNWKKQFTAKSIYIQREQKSVQCYQQLMKLLHQTPNITRTASTTSNSLPTKRSSHAQLHPSKLSRYGISELNNHSWNVPVKQRKYRA